MHLVSQLPMLASIRPSSANSGAEGKHVPTGSNAATLTAGRSSSESRPMIMSRKKNMWKRTIQWLLNSSQKLTSRMISGKKSKWWSRFCNSKQICSNLEMKIGIIMTRLKDVAACKRTSAKATTLITRRILIRAKRCSPSTRWSSKILTPPRLKRSIRVYWMRSKICPSKKKTLRRISTLCQ